jgi:Zn-dependent peptidase ImmA (M78 family)
MKYASEPLRRTQLRALALEMRTLVGLEQEIRFPIMNFLELIMPSLFPLLYVEIVSETYFPPQKHAETDVVNHVIRIREDIYLGAVSGNGRDRMTVAHEVAHYILLVVCGIKFARSFSAGPVITYQDPEWQAKALAGELLCPYHLIRKMNPAQIASACGVSMGAAKYIFDL